MHPHHCIRCGGNDMRRGQIRGMGQVYFELGHHRLFRHDSDVPMHAMMCMDCGYIEMTGNVEAARSAQTNAAGNLKAEPAIA